MDSLSWIVDAAFSTRLTLALLHFLWQGCCCGILVLVGGALLRGASARLRYVLNVAAMCLMAICLPVTFCVLDIPTAVAEKAAALHNVPDLKAVSSARDGLSASSAAQIDSPVSEIGDAREAIAESNTGIDAGRTPADDLDSRHSPKTIQAAFQSMFATSAFQSVSRWVATLYLCGVALILGRLLRGVWGGNRLRRLASVVNDESLLETVGRLSRRLGLQAAPTVAWCEQITIPVVVGIVKPMILLPIAVVSGLTPDQLQALMLHELAHIRRFDPIVNLLQRIIEAVLFFHPVVWFVSRRISIEREHAADDLVLSMGWDRPVYADALVRVAELSVAFSRSGVARRALVLGASGTNPTEFKLRVLRLLDDSVQPELQLSRAGMLTVLLVVAFGGFFAWSQTDKGQTTSQRSNVVEIRDSESGAASANPPPVEDQHSSPKDDNLVENGPSPNNASQDVTKTVDRAATDRDEAAAIKEIEHLGGVVFRDDTSPDNPVNRIAFRSRTLFGDKHVHLLKSVPHLTKLSLSWTLITDVGVKEVGKLTMLTDLSIPNNNQITDASLTEIGKLTNLTVLRLSGCKNITDVGVKEIAGLKNLTRLDLPRTAISDACLKDLRGFSHLTHLGLSQTKVTDAGLNDLRGFTKLATLDLASTKITDAGIKDIQKALPDTNIFARYPESEPPPRTAPKAEEAADEPTAIERIKVLGGSVTSDDALPGRPVTAVNLQPQRQSNSNGLPVRSQSQFDDSDLPVLKSFKHLTKLNLGNTLVTDAGIKELVGLKNLNELDLASTKITDVGLKELATHQSLTTLKLDGCKQITNAGLKELAKLDNLTILSLTSCRQITDAGARELRSLKKLTKIGVHSTEIGDAGIKELCQLENLTSIGLDNGPNTQITDTAAKDLGRLENLTTLTLGGNRITDAGVKELSRLKNLKTFALWAKQVTDEGLAEIAQMSSLTSLNLQTTQIAGAKNLGRLQNLTSLVLVGPQLTDAAVKELSQLENLTYLLLSGPQITDAGVKELRQLKSLTSLQFWSPKLTDAGAKELGELKNLKELSLTDCPEITEAGIEELRKALPEARIPSRRIRPNRPRTPQE